MLKRRMDVALISEARTVWPMVNENLGQETEGQRSHWQDVGDILM